MNQAEIKAQKDSARIVRVTNPFDFEYTHAWGGVPYTLPVGKPLLLPYPLADHLATHLARQAIIRKAPKRDASETDGKGSSEALWTDDSIEALKKTIMVDEYQETQAPVKTEAEILRDKIDELNRAFNEFKEERDGNAPITPAEISGDSEPVVVAPSEDAIPNTGTYLDKAEVIAELDKRGVKYDARASKANLEALLK